MKEPANESQDLSILAEAEHLLKEFSNLRSHGKNSADLSRLATRLQAIKTTLYSSENPRAAEVSRHITEVLGSAAADIADLNQQLDDISAAIKSDPALIKEHCAKLRFIASLAQKSDSLLPIYNRATHILEALERQTAVALGGVVKASAHRAAAETLVAAGAPAQPEASPELQPKIV